MRLDRADENLAQRFDLGRARAPVDRRQFTETLAGILIAKLDIFAGLGMKRDPHRAADDEEDAGLEVAALALLRNRPSILERHAAK